MSLEKTHLRRFPELSRAEFVIHFPSEIPFRAKRLKRNGIEAHYLNTRGGGLGRDLEDPGIRLKYRVKSEFFYVLLLVEVRGGEMDMNFDPLGKLQKLKETALDLGAQKATEAMTQANQLLTLLQDAGYQVGE